MLCFQQYNFFIISKMIQPRKRVKNNMKNVELKKINIIVFLKFNFTTVVGHNIIQYNEDDFRYKF